MATGYFTEAALGDPNLLVLAATEAETEAGHEDHGAADGEAHAEVAHGDDHGSAGMPQLDFATYSNQIFWLVLCLIAIYFLFSRIALPRISGTIEQRAQTIQRDLDRAAEMKLKAEEAEEQYNQALADARSRAHEIAEKTKADIQTKLDEATAKADAEIAKQSDASAKRISKLQKDAEASVGEVAKDVTKAILDALAPSASDDKAIQSALDKVLKD